MPGPRADLAPDAGMRELAARFAQAPPGSSGVEVEAGLAVHIGRLASAAEKMARARASDEIPWTRVSPFDLPNPQQKVVAAGAVTLTDNSWGPRDGKAWDMRRITVQGLAGPGAGTGAVSSTATGSIAAGAGSAALANGVSATGFTLSFSAAPSTTGTAVLSNVTGGSLTFNIPSGQTSPYTVTFPNPITAASAGVAPTLTIAGLGTGAGTIELYGVTAAVAGAAADVVTIYKGSTASAASAIPTNAIDNVTGSGAGADLLITQKGAFIMQAGDILVVSGSSLAAANVAVNASGIQVDVVALPWYLK